MLAVVAPMSISSRPAPTRSQTIPPYDTMLPSPPTAHRPSQAPPSPPVLDLEPSPVYSPLSSPSHSPRPPPSPPLAPLGDVYKRYEERGRMREQGDMRGRGKEKDRLPELKIERAFNSSKEKIFSNTLNTPSDPSREASSVQSSDSIALRSTLRLLMLQRDRASRDIVALEEMRETALKEPLQFIDYITAQKQRGRMTRTNSTSSTKSNSSTEKISSESLKDNIFSEREFPRPQEIYRCPPVEWSKYQILGGPLDAMHESQRNRPSSRLCGANVVPPSMQTGGIIGGPTRGNLEYVDTIGGDSGMIHGSMRLFDSIAQRATVRP